MSDIVKDWNGNDVPLRPGTFWHLSPPRGMLTNNARVGNGVVYSVSAIAEMPGLDKAVSPYALARMNDPKEMIWEEVRTRSYRLLPSRLKSFYCFESKELADRAALEWFGDQTRVPVEVRIAVDARFHRCDAKLLDSTKDQWNVGADRYWRGEMTSAPFPETLVHGAIYLPSWEQFPIGF